MLFLKLSNSQGHNFLPMFDGPKIFESRDFSYLNTDTGTASERIFVS